MISRGVLGPPPPLPHRPSRRCPVRLPLLPPFRRVGTQPSALGLQVPEPPLPPKLGVLRGMPGTVPLVLLLAGSTARDAATGGLLLRLPSEGGELAAVLLLGR